MSKAVKGDFCLSASRMLGDRRCWSSVITNYIAIIHTSIKLASFICHKALITVCFVILFQFTYHDFVVGNRDVLTQSSRTVLRTGIDRLLSSYLYTFLNCIS